jgi:intraflagellar transport protein 172
MKFARTFLQQGQFKETARVLTRYNTPAVQQLLPVYKTICVEVLAAVNEVELQVLREMLQKLAKNLEQTVGDRSNPIFAEFMKFLMVTHLLLLKGECQRYKLDRVNAKLCTSLLRYCKEIRSDKAFYDAGEANKKAGNNEMAYIFLNRYIDLYDAIEDPDTNGITDNEQFEDTDIPSPYDIALPEKNFLSPQERDKIRDWVLQINVNFDIGGQLPVRTCDKCTNDNLYEASLHCRSCNSQWEPCIITGYPLIKSQTIRCKFCNMGALRDDWNDYVSVAQHCPWCNSMQTPY